MKDYITEYGVIAVILILVAIMVAGTMTPHVYALRNFFNCMTEIANKNHKLTIDDVNNCYAKEFHNPPK